MKSHSYFVAQERTKYSLGSPPGGVIWGKKIKFKTTGEWKSEPIASNYDEGMKFVYLGKKMRSFRFMYVFDCKILYPSGDKSNFFTVKMFFNDKEIQSTTIKITEKKQVVREFYLDMNPNDSIHLRLISKHQYNLIELGEYPSSINDFQAESHD